MYGKDIKNARVARGITQLQVAKATGIPQNTISWIELDKGIPNIQQCYLLANFYGITVDELLGISDEYEISAATQKHEDYPLNENDMRFSQIIKELREEKGLSQKELAKNLNIGQSTIAQYENGEREPTIHNLTLYAKYFGVSTDYLLGISDDFYIANSVDIHKTIQTESNSYSPEEKELILRYRNLPEQLKKLVRDQLEVYGATEKLVFKDDKKV